MPLIEVDQETDDYLGLAARVAGLTKGQVVAQLIELVKTHSVADNESAEPRDTLDIYAEYDGQRTLGLYRKRLSTVTITSGPLEGQSFKTPSEAARAVVSHYNPDVVANRNGWTFWLLVDSGAPLQTVRYE